MNVTVKPFSRGSSAIALAYGKIIDEKFVPTAMLYKAPNFKQVAERSVTGRFGTPSYTEEYEVDLSKTGNAIFAVQKWEGISTTRPEKVWEVIYQPE